MDIKNKYKIILAGGDTLAIVLSLIGNVLDSELSDEEKLQRIEAIREAAIEKHATSGKSVNG